MLNLSWKTPRLSVIRAGVGLQCGLSGNSVPDVVTLRPKPIKAIFSPFANSSDTVSTKA